MADYLFVVVRSGDAEELVEHEYVFDRATQKWRKDIYRDGSRRSVCIRSSLKKAKAVADKLRARILKSQCLWVQEGFEDTVHIVKVRVR